MVESIRVGAIDYEIDYINLSTRMDNENGKSMGFCIFEDNLIEINNSMDIERQKQTIIHEMVHAMFFEMGLEDDEDVVNRLGIVLHQVLKDNDFSWVK